jgi:hypothetical protein
LRMWKDEIRKKKERERGKKKDRGIKGKFIQ